MRMLRPILLSTFLGILSACALAGCRFEPREIEFVVPDGFQGPFLIVERPDGQSGEFREGKLTLTVPPSRILAIRDDSAFNEWTKRSARYEGGGNLPIDNEFDASLVALRGGGHGSGVRGSRAIPPHHSYFVGTDAEFMACDYTQLENQIAVQRSSSSP
jgi:hypothetical protein